MAALCRIIGLLDYGLTSLLPQVRRHLEAAQVVIGPQRLLDLAADAIHPEAQRHPLDGRTGEAPGLIRAAWAADLSVIVLASGDPLFHGLGSLLAKHFPPESLEVHPNLSYLQIALARLGMVGDTAARISVHRRDSGPWQPGAGPSHAMYPLIRALPDSQVIAILTSPVNNPARIADLLLKEGLADRFRMTIGEFLCRPDERFARDLEPDQVAQATWADPNVVVLQRIAPWPPLPRFGLPESFYMDADGHGIVTRREVRAVALAQLALQGHETVWDLGAGSGSIALEAARLCPDGWVWAVEKVHEAILRIERNRHQLGVLNLTLLQAKAPAGLVAWPDPDAVFIGGSCSQLDILIQLAWTRLRPRGRLVINLVTMENLQIAMATLNTLAAPWEAVQIQASRTIPVGSRHRLDGCSPIWILTALRGDQP